MKYIRLMLLSLILITLTSCRLLQEITDSRLESGLCGQELYYGDFPEFKSLRQISVYVRNHMNYVESDSIAGPKEAFERAYGDCAEYTLIVSNIAYIQLGLELGAACVFVDLNDRVTPRLIGTGDSFNHAILIDKNMNLYSAYTGIDITEYYEVAYYYPHNKLFDL